MAAGRAPPVSRAKVPAPLPCPEQKSPLLCTKRPKSPTEPAGPCTAGAGVLEQRLLCSEGHRGRARSSPHLTEWLPPPEKVPGRHALALGRDQTWGRRGAGPACSTERQGAGAGEVLPRGSKAAGARRPGRGLRCLSPFPCPHGTGSCPRFPTSPVRAERILVPACRSTKPPNSSSRKFYFAP